MDESIQHLSSTDSVAECDGEGCCSEVHPGEAVDYDIIVGDCLPDGTGGCQRAAAAGKSCCSPIDLTTDPGSRSAEAEASGCCSPPTEEKDDCCGEDDCCVKDDCCGEDDCVDEDECCGEEACCSDAECTGDPTPRIVDEARGVPNKVQAASCNDACCETPSAPNFEKDDCCSGCDKPADISGNAQISNTTPVDSCRNTEPEKPSLRRRRTGSDNQTRVHADPRRIRRRTGTECSAGHAFKRFFEATCCCLIDWSRARHHHHPKKSDAHIAPRRINDHDIYPPRQANDCEPAVVERGEGRRLSMLMGIQGMDCPACAPKVTRALNSVPSVSDVKVNSFSGLATFTYLEGVVLPAAIAKRASELTGFTCSVLEEERSEGQRHRTLRVSLPLPSVVKFDETDLPPLVTVKSSTSSAVQIVLDIEYDSAMIQPREVLDVFSRYGGIALPSAKRDEAGFAQRELVALLFRTSISAAACIPVLVLSWAPIPAHPITYGACSFALTTAIQVYVAAPIYSHSLRSLFLQHILDMDILVTLSSSIAYVFSTVAYFMLVAGHEFSDPLFETPALLITLITLGRLISAYARRRATSALDSLRSLQADTVDLVEPDGGVTSILSELVHVGDTLQVSPHALVPTDGVVVSGHSSVDEASITGESVPVEKVVDSPLTAGTLNGSGLLHMKVERAPSDNTVSSIGKLLAEIQGARLPVQDLADRVASYLAPTVLATAIAVFAIWLAIGMAVRGQSSSTAGIKALQYAITVMVVSCPCALELCVPMVVVISAAVASKNGVLFKSAQAVQYAKDISIAVFDKTGTLTMGELSVEKTYFAHDDARAIALALASGSHHPVAQSVARFLQGVKSVNLEDVKSIPGHGIQAGLSGRIVRGGSPAWLGLTSHPIIKDMQSQAMTMFAVVCEGELIAAFGLRDTVRPSALAAIKHLMDGGIDPYIVSGDAQPVVSALAVELGIPSDHAIGGCLPENKLERVRLLQGTGPSAKRVLFVGDGTNDSLALAQADVGLSLGSGTDIALSAADVVVFDPERTVDLARAMRAVLGISRGAVQRIALNFVWAFVYNAIAVMFAAGAFVDITLPPQFAGLGEMVSVLPVIAVAWTMWLVKW